MLKRGGATPPARFGAYHSKNTRYHLNVVFQFLLEYYFFEVIKMKDFLEVLKAWGPTLATAIISALSAWHLNKKSISADVKAKSRIHWIQLTKKQALDYIMACTELLEELKTMDPFSTYEETDPLVAPCYQVLKTGNALILEFGTKQASDKATEDFADIEVTLLAHKNNKDMNKYIVAHILHVVNPISEFLIKRENRFLDTPALANNFIASINDVIGIFDEKYIQDTRDIMRQYLKREWDIAKKGK